MDNINVKTGKKPYYKDRPDAVKKRDALRMFVNSKEMMQMIGCVVIRQAHLCVTTNLYTLYTLMIAMQLRLRHTT